MIYQYYCDECGEIFEGDYRVGEAPVTRKCPKCKAKSHRYYNFGVKIPNPTSDARKGRGKG